jgi:hypothetical protein
MADPAAELYGLPLERFTPERDAAAKALRRDGDREGAATLAKLPKPSPGAWAANQVARGRPELLRALLDAGEAVREAQESAMTGRGGAALREATAAERKAVDAFMAAAGEERPAGRKLSRALMDRLRSTLHAVAGDEDLRTALAEGRLVGEAEASGAWPAAAFGADLTAAPADQAGAKPPKRPRTPAKRGEEKRRKRTADAEAEEERAAEAARRDTEARAAEERRDLERQLREARADLKVRERALSRAEQDADAAAERLEAARTALQEAEDEARAAARERDEAREAVSRARDDAARLAERLD